MLVTQGTGFLKWKISHLLVWRGVAGKRPTHLHSSVIVMCSQESGTVTHCSKMWEMPSFHHTPTQQSTKSAGLSPITYLTAAVMDTNLSTLYAQHDFDWLQFMLARIRPNFRQRTLEKLFVFGRLTAFTTQTIILRPPYSSAAYVRWLKAY